MWIQIISATKDVLVAAAAVTAAVVGILGLRSWRRELHGRAAYDQARRLMRAVYKVRNAVQFVRRGLIGGDEWPADAPGTLQGAVDPGFHQRLREHVYSTRWGKVSEAVSELEAEALEAEVLWGQDAVQMLQPIRAVLVDLQVALEHFLLTANEQSEDGLAARRAFLFVAGREDDLTRRLNEAVAGIEQGMRVYLRR